LKAALRRVLPDYMVPARIGLLEDLPTTVGGKLDRRALPDLPASTLDTRDGVVAPRTEDERAVAAAFGRALHHEGAISVHDDFFLDLGGDSLAAVSAVCELRGATGMPVASATVRDLYEARTAATLAERMKGRQPFPAAAQARLDGGPRPEGSPVAATAVQAAWLAGKVAAAGAALGYIAFGVLPAAISTAGVVPVVLAAPLVFALALLLRVLLSVPLTVLVKRIVIGRYTPTRAPVWGAFYTRHWIVVSTAQSIPWRWIEGTPVLPFVLRTLGARVGRRVYIHRGVDLQRGGWDLLSIGDGVTLAQDSAVRLVEFEDGQMVVGPVHIGNHATLDVRAGVSPHTVVEPGGFLGPLSWLRPGDRIGANERWIGVPAVRTGSAPPDPGAVRGASIPASSYAMLALALRLAAVFAAWLPAVAAVVIASVVVPDLDRTVTAWLESPAVDALGLVIAAAAAFVIVGARLLVQAAAMRIAGRVPPGVVHQWSLESLRIWTKTGIVDSASRWLSGGLFWPWWLRLAGMRIGRDCEVSTIIDVLPEHVSIGDESFFADGIYFCAPWRHRGAIVVAETALGRNTFLGNHAVVPAGHVWPSGLFIGVATVADPELARDDSTWFGLPPMELPRREVVTADRHVTHDPGLIRYATRLFWEFLRLVLPVVPLLVAFGWYASLADAATRTSRPVLFLLLAPAVTFGAAAALAAAVLALKWLLLGRVKPGQHPLWSCWCSRWDFFYVAWNQWARAALVQLEGTLLLNAYLRLMGMRIGRRVVLGPGFAQVVDPDMLTFEDGATVSSDLQAHTFEDRVLKIDRVRVGRGATVGSHTVVFYGADVGNAALVAPHGIVMKRDVLEPGLVYAGSPTRAVA
jgi:non-ribosomal peptide synthetase-like protein